MLKIAFQNKYLVIVFSLLVVIISLVALQKLPVDILPSYKSSAVQILTLYPGMPSEVMEKDITSRLERWTGQAEGLESQESKSMIGVSIIKNYFRPEIDASTAMAQATSLATSDMYYLPPGTIPPMVMPFDPTASVPLALLAVSSDKLSEKELYDIAYFQLRNLLGSVQGIIAPAVYGGKLRRIYMYVYPEKLEAYHLSQTDVVSAIQKNNIMIPTGDINIGNLNYSVNANGMLPKVTDFNDMIIKTGKDGAPVFLHDIGYAKDASAIQTNIVHINGKRQVYIPIYKRSRANTIAAINAVNGKLEELKARLPASVKLAVILDQSSYVRNSISGLVREGITGLVLVSLALLLFLGNFRSTLIVFMSIPLSVLFTFIAMYFTGDSINSITLGGIALSIGLLVDDSIVVLENIEKHLRTGKAPAQAAYDGAQEVAMPVLVTTLTICIVFFPIVFLTGIAKFLFTPLAVVVCFAMIGSRIFSMTLVPIAAAALFKPVKATDHEKPGLLGRFDRYIIQITARFSKFTIRTLAWSWQILLGTALIFILSVWGFTYIGTELFPKMDVGQISLNMRLESGTRIEFTEKTVSAIEIFIKKEIGSDLNRTVSNMGVLNDWPAAYSPNSGTQDASLSIQLKEGHKPTQVYVDLLRKKLGENFPGVEFIFNTGGIISQALNFGLPSPIDIQVTGNDLQTSRKIAETIRAAVKSVSGTTDVRIQQRYDHPEIQLHIDRLKAATLGINADDIVKNTVSALNSSVNFKPSFWIDQKNGNHYFVGVTYQEKDLNSISALDNIAVTSTGASPMSLLKNVSTRTLSSSPIEINHLNIQRVTDIFANVESRDIGSVSAEIDHILAKISKGLPAGYSVTSRGEVQSMKESFGNLGLGLGLAVLLVFLIIVPLLRSFTLPLIIVTVIPLGLTGVTAMLLLTHTYLNIQSMMGIIMMAGISVAYSNLLVDKMNNLLKEGKSVIEAIEQGISNRLRPILMTSIVAILALLPMAIGYETGGEANVPLTRSIIGGVLAATVVTLFVVPVLFYMFNKKLVLKPMKITPFFLLAISLIIISSCTNTGNTPALISKPKQLTVETITPAEHSFTDSIQLSGNAMPFEQTYIVAQTSGYVEKVSVDLGSRVHKGQVIAVLSNPDLEKNRTVFAADLMAKTSMNTRLQTVAKKTPQLTTAMDVENALSQFQMASAQVKANKIQLDLLKIKAPFDGIITRRYINIGDVVQNGLSSSIATTLFSIENPDPIRLTLNIPEADAVKITQNTLADVLFADLPSYKYVHKISRQSSGLENDTKTMKLEIDLPNKEHNIKSGMFAKVGLVLTSHSIVMALPNEAIGNINGKGFIFLVIDGRVKKVNVITGMQDDSFIEVSSPELTMKSQVIVKGKELAIDGAQVNIHSVKQ